MPLVSMTVQGYQSYRDPQTVAFDDHLTLIAGRNDVGKSSLLRVLRLFIAAQEGATEDFELVLRWRVEHAALMELTQGQSSLVADWLAARGVTTIWLTYRRNTANPNMSGNDLQVVRVEIPEGPGVLEGAVGSGLGWTLGPSELVDAQSAAGNEIFATLGQRLAANVTFIGPRTIPAGMRGLTATVTLSSDGSNVTDVLHTLHTERSPIFDHIETFMRSAFPQIEKIGVKLQAGAPITGVPAIYYRHAPDVPVLLEQAGSGIGQMLVLATGVLTNTHSRLFLIDEPQAFLHPQAERDLLSLLEEHAEHQYVIATHSHFLLSAKPLSQARLLRIENGSTRVFDATHDQLLNELGITAADLWLADRILWVEGSTEVHLFELLLDRLPAGRPPGTWVKEMPIAASMFTRPGGRADVSFRFVNEVVDATRGVRIKMRFLFDRDEKSDDEQQRLVEASGGTAEFLARREVENYLLDGDLIYEALLALRAQHGVETGFDRDLVSARLIELLTDTQSQRIYPKGIPEGADLHDYVKGSEVLDVLWSEFATARYDKPRDGAALATLALERNPQLLDPLAGILTRLVEEAP